MLLLYMTQIYPEGCEIWVRLRSYQGHADGIIRGALVRVLEGVQEATLLLLSRGQSSGFTPRSERVWHQKVVPLMDETRSLSTSSKINESLGTSINESLGTSNEDQRWTITLFVEQLHCPRRVCAMFIYCCIGRCPSYSCYFRFCACV